MSTAQIESAGLMSVLRAYQIEKGLSARLRPPTTTNKWPLDYVAIEAWRNQQRYKLASDAGLVASAKSYYSGNPEAFINHWITTYDPRNAQQDRPVYLPLIMFRKQAELVRFVMSCLTSGTSGLVEKSRDMGATWVCCALSVWLWLYHPGTSIGWGSAKSDKVDRIGDPSSIFEKIRIAVRRLPKELLPVGFNERDHLYFLRCLNPENGSSIIGEIGDNIGRGGRTSIYFKDESAHYEHPELIEAALLSNTRSQIDISSVSGPGTVFHSKRESYEDWKVGDKMTNAKSYVFVMDWSDHPAKTKEWHDTEKAKMSESGLQHVFAQEIERDYASTVEGRVMELEWIRSAIDAHKKLGIEITGGWSAALDVADEGADRNAGSVRHGILLTNLELWGERDTAATARRMVKMAEHCGPIDVQYDSIGVGAGVKGEINNLKADGKLPKGMNFIPWNAGASVINPFKRVIEDDKGSPLNKDFYQNLKAQAWWNLRRRFELTHRAVTDKTFRYKPDDLISIDSKLPLLRALEKELLQVTRVYSSKLKLMIDKQPEGMKSPNLADSVVMNYFPILDQRLSTTVGIATPLIVRG